MAQDGHPYFTKALDETRSRQRQLLRGIPDWIVERVPLPRGEPTFADDGLVETELRKIADRGIAELEDALPRFAEHVRVEGLVEFLQTRELTEYAEAVNSLANEILERRREAYVGEHSKDEYRALVRTITPLVWADDLAGDYVDSRVKVLRERGT